MKLRKELIGSKIYHAVLNKYITIEEGKEDTYSKLAMDVFEEPAKPKLQKNDKAKKKRYNDFRSDSDGISDDN